MQTKHALVVILMLMVVGCDASLSSSYAPDMTRAIELREHLGGGAASSADSGSDFSSGAQPTGWATLKGNFKFVGDAPKPATLMVEKDTEVCAPGGKQILSEELIVNGSGGIKNVVIYLDTKIPVDEPWTHPDAAPGNAQPIEFDQKNCIFLSHVLGMQTSQPLKILNSDPVGHNAKLSPKENPQFNQIIPGNSEAIYQPSSQESSPFPVACSIHPWMNAHILIRDNGYFAVTDENGDFEILNLPAGVELTFRVWQEKSKFLSDVSVNGSAVKWKKGRFTLQLDGQNEQSNTLAVTVDDGAF